MVPHTYNIDPSDNQQNPRIDEEPDFCNMCKGQLKVLSEFISKRDNSRSERVRRSWQDKIDEVIEWFTEKRVIIEHKEELNMEYYSVVPTEKQKQAFRVRMRHYAIEDYAHQIDRLYTSLTDDLERAERGLSYQIKAAKSRDAKSLDHHGSGIGVKNYIDSAFETMNKICLMEEMLKKLTVDLSNEVI